MIQAFYTVATGMQAQQKNIDVISNNIANINTPGYRIRRAEFMELLRSQLGNEFDIGHGTKVSNISMMPLPEGINPFGLTINGEGYFVTEDSYGLRSYTKDGNFKLISENGRYYLATQEGNFVLDRNFNRIEMDKDPDNFILSGGAIFSKGNHGEEGVYPAIVKFENEDRLALRGRNSFVQTEVDGEVYLSTTTSVSLNYIDELTPITMMNQMNEIMKIVQTQMAYQLNSKALQVVDEMEGMVNHLRY